MKIGVLALQGSFVEHIAVLNKLNNKYNKLNIEAVEIRLPEQLKEMDGLIIPGGESTTMMQLIRDYGFIDALKEFAGFGCEKSFIKPIEESNRKSSGEQNGKPIMGTCAGCIVLANMGFIDIKVERNAYGSQLESFEDDIVVDFSAVNSDVKKNYHSVFIRAPKIIFVGKNVQVIGKCNNNNNKYENNNENHEPVLVKEKKIICCTFHPELSDDDRMHKMFIGIVSGYT
ncbi:MAG: pyridoxal 5'-phosphate synthase glutaminase subunit PdxT [Candidatus Woesearchaeota archaeon]